MLSRLLLVMMGKSTAGCHLAHLLNHATMAFNHATTMFDTQSGACLQQGIDRVLGTYQSD